MPEPSAVVLRAVVEESEVLRYLGYPTPSACSSSVLARVHGLWPRAEELLAPRGAFRVVSGREAAGAGMPGARESVAVAVCTIGPALEAESAAASARGALLEALILDAFGSAAAEAAADSLNLRVCDAARTRGLAAAPRVSPGYGKWDVARQRELLALLPAAKLGITLTSGGMMVPRKSVSFAASFATPAELLAVGGSSCERCGMVRCRHRVVAAVGAANRPV